MASCTRVILTAAGTARMHRRSFAADPRLSGYAHGFMERTVNGHRMATLIGNTDEFQYRVPLSFRLLLGVPVVVLVAFAAAAVLTVKGWRGSGAGVPARTHQIAMLVGLAALAWFLWRWNLVGWQYA